MMHFSTLILFGLIAWAALALLSPSRRASRRDADERSGSMGFGAILAFILGGLLLLSLLGPGRHGFGMGGFMDHHGGMHFGHGFFGPGFFGIPPHLVEYGLLILLGLGIVAFVVRMFDRR